MRWCDIILDEQMKGEIPVTDRRFPAHLQKEIYRRFGPYEVLHHKAGRWVCYKTKGGGPNAVMFKQFEFPQDPGPWLLDFMACVDQGNESFNEWLARAREKQEKAERRLKENRKQLAKDIALDYIRYVQNGRITCRVPN
jgi:hypothetical protein